jgi:16S rRNA G966 N2-methylase RsmD
VSQLSNRYVLHYGDCREILRTIPDASIDAVITDPPYPYVDREYGYWTEDEFHALMDAVIPELRRVLKSKGSAMFVLQPNMERLGRVRPWLWDFLARWTREWGMVQDAYAWNVKMLPSIAGISSLMRPSVRICAWFGPPDCYRNQKAVLWAPSEANRALAAAYRAAGIDSTPRVALPSGYCINHAATSLAYLRRGGVTPFNLLPVAGRCHQRGESNTHGAQTPPKLSNWWIRYLCPPDGVVLDPFAGVASIGIEALRLGRRYIGIEVTEHHCRAAANNLRLAIRGSARV